MYFISHPSCKRHEMGDAHPESPRRLSAIEQHLEQRGIWSSLNHLEACKANRSQLGIAHSDAMITHLFESSPTQGYAILDADTQMNPFSLDAALYATGAGLMALEKILNTGDRVAFCSVRPPGHHAESDQAMGFCLFNAIAITALHALQHESIERVAIVDFDVHHGNGTEDIVAGVEQIQFTSTFQHPLYPGSGVPASASNVCNYPLNAGTGSATVRALWTKTIIPQLARFQPNIILVSAGFDAHRDDPLASLNFEDEDYAFFGRALTTVAEKYCQGRLISFLEGGYHLEALGRSVTHYIESQLSSPA